MGRARFTCEYCNKSFEDGQEARRRHNSGRAHKANVKLWYDSFQDQAQRSTGRPLHDRNAGGVSECAAVAPFTQVPAPAPVPAPHPATIDPRQLPPSMIPPPPELFLYFRTDWG